MIVNKFVELIPHKIHHYHVLSNVESGTFGWSIAVWQSWDKYFIKINFKNTTIVYMQMSLQCHNNVTDE